MNSLLKMMGVYLICLAAIGAGVYACIAFFAQKTLYLDQKQWNPAEPETQHIDQARLNKALDYIDTRLPTARSLLMLRNGKTVVEKYYWHGSPKARDYLHSLNLPLLQVLIGVAIDHQLINGPEQRLSAFFQKHQRHFPSDGSGALTLGHLLRVRASLQWGSGSRDYWALFYAADRIEASLRIVARQQTSIQPAINFAAAYLLGQVIEQVSGESVFDFAHRHLFQPLGIKTYAAGGNDRPRDPMVGFQLRALDLAKIGHLLSRIGIWDGRRIVSEHWVRTLFSKAPHARLRDLPGGGWTKTAIRGHESLLVRGEGGQYLALVPAVNVVVATTSTSFFALPQDNGHDRLLQLLMEAVLETPDTTGKAVDPQPAHGPATARHADFHEPNYVFSTPVPREILDFFHQFAQDVAARDTHRIAGHYARGYDHSRDIFSSPSRLMFGGSPPQLEYVHITRIRIEKNRAYLRGRMKFAYRTYAGSQGVFPLENLIKLKGRWKWLGVPEKTDLLDRDAYFDVELSEAQQRFVDACAGPLTGKSSLFGNDCFAEPFHFSGGGKELLAQRLQPFLRGSAETVLHVTELQRNGAVYRVQGYIEGSALGDLRLPEDLHIVKEKGEWKWQGVSGGVLTE